MRQENTYMAVKYLHDTEQYPVKELCRLLHLNRSAYYKWMKRKSSQSRLLNEQIVELIEELYEEQDGILGYRQMTITINRKHGVKYNHKRIYRLMNIPHLKSVCRRKRRTYIPSTPEVTTENILNREFYADKPNEKWLTDVTEFKYYVGLEVKKLYLSAILDLYDRRIVAYRIGASNNNQLVFDTFDDAVAANSDAYPLFHSDRGYQHTSKTFHSKLMAAKLDIVLTTVLWKAAGEF